MSNLEMKVDALMRLVTSEDGPSYDAAKAEVLRLMGTHENKPEDSQNGLVEMIEDTLTKFGMPNHILGFDYNVEAIRLAVEDKEILNDFTKKLYPSVAAKFGTTASRAERAMRHGIELCWDRCDNELINEYFGCTISPC